MFSPFRDDSGTPKELADVTFADLAQLRDYEEGFALEFKQTFGESVRRKIPKIVASFANSHGGLAGHRHLRRRPPRLPRAEGHRRREPGHRRAVPPARKPRPALQRVSPAQR